MSIVRFGPDSDVYAYPNMRGSYDIHVAAYRWEKPVLEPMVKIGSHNDDYKITETSPNDMIPIGLKYDGHSFVVTSLEAVRDKLLMLKNEGYHVPDSAFDNISNRLNERDGQ